MRAPFAGVISGLDLNQGENVQIGQVFSRLVDDIIATLATQATTRGFTVGIVSGDRDTFQLVDERTTVLYPRKGVSDLARMTPEAIVEKYGLNPGQYADFAALRGDRYRRAPAAVLMHSDAPAPETIDPEIEIQRDARTPRGYWYFWI